MRWQRYVQIAVGLAGLGVVIALVVTRKDRPVVAPPPSIGSIDPKTESQSGRGTLFFIGKDGTTSGTLAYENRQTYEDGSARFEGVVLAWLEGEKFTLKASVAETKGKPNDQPDSN